MSVAREPKTCPYGKFRKGSDGLCECYGCLDDLKEGLDDPVVQDRRHKACSRTCVRWMSRRPPITQPLSDYAPELKVPQ